MGTSYNPSPVYDSSLIFCLDGMNVKCTSSQDLIRDISPAAVVLNTTNLATGTVSLSSGAFVFSPAGAATADTCYWTNAAPVTASYNELTMECLFKVGAFQASAGLSQSIPFQSRVTETVMPIGFSICTGTFGTYIQSQMYSSGAWNTPFYYDTRLTTGSWMHITITTSVAAGNKFKTYINGQNVIDFTFGGTPAASNGLYVGRGFYGGYNNFSGSISLARYYTRALTADEVVRNFNAVKGRFGL